MDIDAYTPQQFNNAFSEIIKKLLCVKTLSREKEPKAFLLGGQSGAGKTTLSRIISVRLNGNVIVINGDEYRKSHPRFKEIQERYGVDAPAHTAAWAGKMTEALIDALSEKQYNLIIEGTLRTSDVPMRTATLLRSRDYSVSLAIMAVKPEISLVSCKIRYEMMRIAGTTPRATDPKHHDRIVHDIANNLSTLESSGLFERVLIYNRAAKCLYPVEGATRSASETLCDVLFGDWSEEERLHYEHLQEELEALQSQ